MRPCVLLSRDSGRDYALISESESGRKRVAYREGETGDVDIVEFDIVVNQVIMSFWANESVSPEVIANVASEVAGKVVTAHVVRTA